MRVREPEDVTTFISRTGEEKIIHRNSRGRLAVKHEPSPILSLTNSIAPLIGQRIKEKRKEIGMTMAELGRRAGLTNHKPKNRIYEIEHGLRGGIRLGTLYSIAMVLNIEPTGLLPPMKDVFKNSNVCLETEKRIKLKS